MGEPNHSEAAAPEHEAVLSWDLIPDERAPARAIIMRFASYEAAHAVLTAAGFALTSDAAPVQAHPLRPTVVSYAHPDGSTVVLAHRPVERHGEAEPCQEGLGLATVGG